MRARKSVLLRVLKQGVVLLLNYVYDVYGRDEVSCKNISRSDNKISLERMEK